MSEILGTLDPRAALVLHLGVVAFVMVAILVVAGTLREPGRPGFGIYDSGAPPGPALLGRTATQYFLIAVIFMIFDVEVALLFSWAVAAKLLGPSGLIAATVFIVVLLAALAWLWLDGALETAPPPREAEDAS